MSRQTWRVARLVFTATPRGVLVESEIDWRTTEILATIPWATVAELAQSRPEPPKS